MRTNFVYEPKEDITTFELAQAVKMLIASHEQYRSVERMRAVYDELPESVQRHFRVENA